MFGVMYGVEGSTQLNGGEVGAMIQFDPEASSMAITGFVGEGVGAWVAWTFDSNPDPNPQLPGQFGVFIGLNDGTAAVMAGTDITQPEPNILIGGVAGGNELSVDISGPAIYDHMIDGLSEPYQWLERNIERLYGVPAP